MDDTTSREKVEILTAMDLPIHDIVIWIFESIPSSLDRHILHDVNRIVPGYFSLLWKYYPGTVLPP